MVKSVYSKNATRKHNLPPIVLRERPAQYRANCISYEKGRYRQDQLQVRRGVEMLRYFSTCACWHGRRQCTVNTDMMPPMEMMNFLRKGQLLGASGSVEEKEMIICERILSWSWRVLCAVQRSSRAACRSSFHRADL